MPEKFFPQRLLKNIGIETPSSLFQYGFAVLSDFIFHTVAFLIVVEHCFFLSLLSFGGQVCFSFSRQEKDKVEAS